MVAKSVDKQRMKKTVVTLLLLAVAAVAAVYGIRAIKESKSASASIPGGTAEEREVYLAALGIQVDTKSSVAEVQVPTEFDERFAEYNEMQRAMGFDLEPIKGERLKKCVYTVTNMADLGDRISAVLLVKDTQVVGGHLLNEDTGELYPLFDVGGYTDEASVETILPVPAAAEDEGEETGAAAEEPVEETSADAYPTD